MFKLVKNFNNLSLLVPRTALPLSKNLKTLRRHKKPLVFPTAKSKIFVVKPRVRLPIDEEQELKRLYNNYRTTVKSIRKYFEDEYKAQSTIQFDEELHKKIIAEDFQSCSKINEEWNTKVSIEREARVEKEFELNLHAAREKLEKTMEEKIKKQQDADRIVKEQIEASHTFITPDKLDAAIEYAINNPVDYNYALEVDGTKTFGRETKISFETKDKTENKQ